MRVALFAAALALIAAACGAGASPAGPGQLGATPAVQRTTLPSLSPGRSSEGY